MWHITPMSTHLADCRLYGILDMGYTSPDAIETKTAALLAGGIRILQLRTKNTPPDTIRTYARRMHPLCRAAHAIFVLNDYPDIAVEIGADAVHVGQDAGPLAGIRRIVGPRMIIGRSTHSPEQALAAQAEGADYIGFGPLYPTGTKPGRPSIGLQDIAAVQQKLGELPMFCIGGINGTTLPAVLAAGARRIVIVSWLLQQPDITTTTRQIITRLNQETP